MILTRKNPLPITWSVQGTSQNVPDLTMLINPANLETQYTPLITETRTLGGFIHEFWGEQLTSLSAAGKTAMFIDEGGLSRENQRQTESYQYFISLLNIYKNNGKDYYNINSTIASQRNQNRITNFGYINMTFDSKQFLGHFDSFEWTEDAIKPFTLDYQFTFKVFKTFSSLQVSAQTQTYALNTNSYTTSTISG